jgi:dTDP-4-dehydrorhamnose reductase
MKVVVIGAKGMLGSELCATLSPSHEVVAWDIGDIDIANRPLTLEKLKTLRPDFILNTAAIVDVEVCEKQPDAAWNVNAVGSQNLALASRTIGSDYLLISTDYVFDGTTQEDYNEFSAPNPINHYGKSKLAGERLAAGIWPRTFIVRTAWLFGHKPKNYVDRVLSAAEKDGVVRMAEDQLESPTYAVHLAQAVRDLITTGAYGTYNVTSIGACTRLEFARYVLDVAGRSAPLEKLDAAKIARTARRPRRTVLDCRLYQLVTGRSLPEWRKGVDEYLSRAGA